MDQGLQVRHLKVRLGLRWRGSPEAPLGGTPVDPNGVQPHPLGRDVVVKEALRNVQQLPSGNTDPIKGQLEVLRGGLVGAGSEVLAKATTGAVRSANAPATMNATP